jgi:xylan 1,4-beta-xylosidase
MAERPLQAPPTTARSARSAPGDARPVRFRNPVLSGFHPDPSICRVGSDYYLVTTTMEYFPGIPIFTSRDLVNWRQIGHCLTRDSQLDLRRSRQGIYAPTLRHHAGVYYVTSTNVGAKGNFYVTATDPAGPWSDPFWYDQPGIDPSLFFEQDGTAYFTSTNDDVIIQSTFDPSNGKRTSDIRTIWTGTGGRYPEAPHLYRTHGRYYLMIAEGGTEYGHMETLARSESPWGPFEPCPHNPIFSHRDHSKDPIQATGHADLVECPDGSSWLVCLGIRLNHRFWQYHHLGRETFLCPVTWDEAGWPRVNDNGTIPLESDGPSFFERQSSAVAERDHFDREELSATWNHRRNPRRENCSLAARPGWLRLTGGTDSLDSELGSPTFVGRRQQHFDCRFAALVDFEPANEKDEAGIAAFMSPSHHYELRIVRRDGGRKIELHRRIGDLATVTKVATLASGPVELEIRADPSVYRFGVRTGGEFQEMGTGATRYLSKEVAGGFGGVYLALYATGNGARSANPADFDWCSYEPSAALPAGSRAPT